MRIIHPRWYRQPKFGGLAHGLILFLGHGLPGHPRLKCCLLCLVLLLLLLLLLFFLFCFGDPWCVAFQVWGVLLVSVSVITWLLVRFATACRLLIFPSMPLALAYSIFKVSPFFLFLFPLFLLFCFLAWWGVYSKVVLFSRLKVTPFLVVWGCLVVIFSSLVPAVLYWLRVLVGPLLPLFGCSYSCRGFFILVPMVFGLVRAFWAP